MSRIQSVIDHFSKQRLMEEALQRFDRDGYRGTSIREIAAGANCSVGAFYSYFRSKQQVLLEIIDTAYGAAIAEVETAVALAGDDPVSRLKAAVWAQCDLHLRLQRAFRVARAELGNLEPADRERLQSKRVQFTQIIHGIVVEGAAAGVFDTAEPEATTRALTTMCGVAGAAYDPGGHQVPRKIAQVHCEMAVRLAGVEPRLAPAVRRLGDVAELRTA